MKSEIEDNKTYGLSNSMPHPRTLWLAIPRILLIVCFLSKAMAAESSQPNRVSYAFDDDAKHLVVASCYEGLGKLLLFDVKANPYPL